MLGLAIAQRIHLTSPGLGGRVEMIDSENKDWVGPAFWGFQVQGTLAHNSR